MMGDTWAPYSECPCGCGVIGWKLSNRTGHVVRDCKCRPCISSRNVRKGKRAQAKGHRALGGTGFTPGNEESVGGYPIVVQVEHKAGAQVPASFHKFTSSEWFRHALRQAEIARRVGDTGSLPSVMIDGRWLVTDCRSVGPGPS